MEIFKKRVTVLGVERFCTLIDCEATRMVGVMVEEGTEMKRGDLLMAPKEEQNGEG
jgi:hypothetical protein